MGHFYGKLAGRDREKREAPPNRSQTTPLGPGLPCQRASPAACAQSPASLPRSAASASPQSLIPGSPRPSTANPSRVAPSSTPSSRWDDFLPPSRPISDRSMTSTSRQRQLQQSSASSVQDSGPARFRHVHGCKCHVCRPDFYDGADPRLIKRSAVRGVFMESCVEACRCPRCCEERGDSTIF